MYPSSSTSRPITVQNLIYQKKYVPWSNILLRIFRKNIIVVLDLCRNKLFLIVRRSHLPLHKLYEQWQSSHIGLEPLWEKHSTSKMCEISKNAVDILDNWANVRLCSIIWFFYLYLFPFFDISLFANKPLKTIQGSSLVTHTFRATCTAIVTFAF